MDRPDLEELAQTIARDRTDIRRALRDTIPAAGAVERERLRWIARADRAELWRPEGARNSAEFLAGLFQISQWKARRWIDAAHALEALPRTAATLEAGALSLDKVVELARFATADTEETLIRWARKVTPGGIRKRADAATRQEIEEERAVHEGRHVLYSWYDDRLKLEADLTREQGACLVQAVDELAHKLPTEPDDATTGDDAGSVSLDQRRADALVLLVSRRDEGSSQPATVVLHAPAEILAGDDGGCCVEGGPVLHPETARRIACDARLQMVLESDEQVPLGIGRESHNVPRWLRRQVFHRDGYTCTHPGCEMKTFLHPHHIWHWIRGGPTELWNLITVCTFHHRLLHEGGWDVALDEEGRAIWFRPDRTRYDPGPPIPEAEPAPAVPDVPLLAEAAGYARLGTIIDLLAGRLRPDPERARRTLVRAREKRLPEWARLELQGSAR